MTAAVEDIRRRARMALVIRAPVSVERARKPARVRTPAGVRRYDQPIGTLIVANVLDNLRSWIRGGQRGPDPLADIQSQADVDQLAREMGLPSGESADSVKAAAVRRIASDMPGRKAAKAPAKKSRRDGITPQEFEARHDAGTRAGLSDAEAARYARSDYDSPRAWREAHPAKAAKKAPAKKAPAKRATPSAEDRQRRAEGFARRYERGESISQIAAAEGVSYSTVHSALTKDAGIQLRPRGGAKKTAPTVRTRNPERMLDASFRRMQAADDEAKRKADASAARLADQTRRRDHEGNTLEVRKAPRGNGWQIVETRADGEVRNWPSDNSTRKSAEDRIDDVIEMRRLQAADARGEDTADDWAAFHARRQARTTAPAKKAAPAKATPRKAARPTAPEAMREAEQVRDTGDRGNVTPVTAVPAFSPTDRALLALADVDFLEFGIGDPVLPPEVVNALINTSGPRPIIPQGGLFSGSRRYELTPEGRERVAELLASMPPSDSQAGRAHESELSAASAKWRELSISDVSELESARTRRARVTILRNIMQTLARRPSTSREDREQAATLWARENAWLQTEGNQPVALDPALFADAAGLTGRDRESYIRWARGNPGERITVSRWRVLRQMGLLNDGGAAPAEGGPSTPAASTSVTDLSDYRRGLDQGLSPRDASAFAAWARRNPGGTIAQWQEQRQERSSPRPQAAPTVDESVPLAGGPNRWDDNMRMHGDSHTMRLARAYADAGRNGSANRLIELRRRATTAGTDGLTPQQVVDELRAIRATESDPAFQRQIDRAIEALDAPMTPMPELPANTPPLARQLIERLHAIPRARKGRGALAGDGRVRGQSLIDQTLDVYRDASAGRRSDDGRQPADRIRSILRDQVHEMDESSFRIWALADELAGGSPLAAELRQWERSSRG